MHENANIEYAVVLMENRKVGAVATIGAILLKQQLRLFILYLMCWWTMKQYEGMWKITD